MQAAAVASFVRLDHIPLLKVLASGRALEYQCKFAIFCDLGLLKLSYADAQSPFLTFLEPREYRRSSELRHVLSMRSGDLLEHRWCVARAECKIFRMNSCSPSTLWMHISPLCLITNR